MSPAASSSSPRSSQTLTRVLDAKGFAVDDFEVDEDSDVGIGRLLGVVGGLLRVRCGSTGEERVYSIGSSSTWLGAFLGDLEQGHFANAARTRTRTIGSLLLGASDLADRSAPAALRQ